MINDFAQPTLFSWKNPEQQYLEVINKEYRFVEALQILNKIDWDFKGFKTQYLTHKFHSYPARFIPQIPLTFIKLFTKEGETVLDPMCGCGTTLVEAFLNNRNSIGNDFNPLATLISKVKITLIPDTKFNCLKKKLQEMKRYLTLGYGKDNKRVESLPNRKISKLFDKIVISKLEIIRDAVLEIREECKDDDIYDLGRVALSSAIWSLVESGGGLDVGELFLKKINFMEKELKNMSEIVREPPKVRIITGDARRLDVESNSVDLIVTSPPYVNALDYYRVYMYNMLWLDMDFDLFKKYEIGAHSHFIYNRFRLLSEYLGDMLRVMVEMNRVLKKNKLCVIVVGNSSLEYELIESYKFFAEMSKFVGFKVIKTYFRNIDKTKKYANADIGKIDDEYILVLQKVANSDVASDNDDFVVDIVTQQMIRFKKQIEKVQGTSIKGRRPTKERLLRNIDKIEEAIQYIREDIKMER